MKHITLFLTIMICTVHALRAQYHDAAGITVSDTRIVRSDAGVALSFTVSSQKHSVGRNYSAAMQPVITDGEHKVSFPAVLIQGKRAQTLESRYQWAASGQQTADYPTVIVRLLPGQQGAYNAVVEYQPWMEGADLTLEKLVWGCCTSEAPESAVLFAGVLPPAPTPEPVPVPVVLPQPEPRLTTGDRLAQTHPFVVRDPGGDYEGFVNSDRQNALIVYYRVNRRVIEPDFSGNRATLDELTEVVKTIMESTDSRVSRIVIAGFASPEGVLSSNEKLAQDRAAAVGAYISETTGLEPGLISLYNGAEDWYGLRMLIEGSDVEWKQRALDILDNTAALSAVALRSERLEKLRSLDGGEPYRYILANFFPKLRNGAFIRVYYDDQNKLE